MKKKRLRQLCCVLGLLVLTAVLYAKAEDVLRHKLGSSDPVTSFYDEPKNSMDVLIVGSSHAYRAFSPMVLWEEAGITGYCQGTPSQSFVTAYYLLKDALRVQSPKVVVLETLGARYKNDYLTKDAARMHQALTCMPYGKARLEFLTEYIQKHPEGQIRRIDFWLPLLYYHQRWDRLTKTDFVPNRTYLKGFRYTKRISPLIIEPETEITESRELASETAEYLDKIIDLCRNEGTELVLVQAPMAEGEPLVDKRKAMNAVREIAKERGIPYLSFEDKEVFAASGLDYHKDFRDNEHLNAYGAEKVTRYLAKWLTERYPLPGEHEQSVNEKWERDYKKYLKYVDSYVETEAENAAVEE